jgi:hypothetical protein
MNLQKAIDTPQTGQLMLAKALISSQFSQEGFGSPTGMPLSLTQERSL